MASNHPLRRRKRDGGHGKTTCKSVEQESNHEKPPLVVGQKPNRKCQVSTAITD